MSDQLERVDCIFADYDMTFDLYSKEVGDIDSSYHKLLYSSTYDSGLINGLINGLSDFFGQAKAAIMMRFKEDKRKDLGKTLQGVIDDLKLTFTDYIRSTSGLGNVELYDASLRQDRTIDLHNQQKNKNGSCFDVFESICEGTEHNFIKLRKDLCFDGDKPGSTWDEKNSNKVTWLEMSLENYLFERKLSIFFKQTKRVKAYHPDSPVYIRMYDDRPDILQSLEHALKGESLAGDFSRWWAEKLSSPGPKKIITESKEHCLDSLRQWEQDSRLYELPENIHVVLVEVDWLGCYCRMLKKLIMEPRNKPVVHADHFLNVVFDLDSFKKQWTCVGLFCCFKGPKEKPGVPSEVSNGLVSPLLDGR